MMYPVQLDSDHIFLREASAADAEALQRVVGDPVVCQTLIFEPKTVEETREYVADWETKAQATPRVHYYLGVVRRAGNELIGAAYLGLFGVTEDETDSGMLGGAIRADLWSEGYATEAVSALMKFGFTTLGLQRVWGSCGPESPTSIHLMEKVGMRFEARLRDHRQAKGVWRDSLVYGITEPEWASRQAAATA